MTPASCDARSPCPGSSSAQLLTIRQIPTAPATLLGWLQHDLRANAVPTPAERASREHDTTDRSVQVHACHGGARQVDVLREVLVGLLDDDPTLEPRDILVMCPDIENYAPLISAGFGLADVVEEAGATGSAGAAGSGHPAHRLRVRLADRALTSTNPLLGIATALVELAGGRVTASAVLDLASTPVVRARFGFSDDDLDRITRWVAQAGIRWGLDAAEPRTVRHGPVRPEHLAGRTRPDPARRGAQRRRPPAPGPRPPGRRRRQR